MNTTLLKEELLNLKKILPVIEKDLDEKILSVEIQKDNFINLDKEFETRLSNQHNKRIKLNIGGKLFYSTLGTILSQKDTFFYKLILSNKFNLDEEIFIDRNPRLFPIILEYLKEKTFNLEKYKYSDHFEIYLESLFYNIPEINSQIKGEKGKNVKAELEFIGFEFNGPYFSNTIQAGTNKVEDLNDRSGMKGICANSPGWILIEFNDVYAFMEIEIGGWCGNSLIWASSNGNLARIEVSLDKLKWETAGKLPGTYSGNIEKLKFEKLMTGKYIRFTHNSYLGIGYLKIYTQ